MAISRALEEEQELSQRVEELKLECNMSEEEQQQQQALEVYFFTSLHISMHQKFMFTFHCIPH